MKQYDFSNIKKMIPAEHIRQTPSLYIGFDQFDSDALHGLIGYVCGNSANPLTQNESTQLKVTLRKNGQIVIEDDGRGLPVEPCERWHTSNFRNLPCFVHAIEWFAQTGERRDDSYTRTYYKNFGFLDYLGLVLNATSEYLRVETVWNGVLYAIACSRGETIEPFHKIGEADRKGTRITYLPDKELFSDCVFKPDKLSASLNALKTKFPNVKYNLEKED